MSSTFTFELWAWNWMFKIPVLKSSCCGLFEQKKKVWCGSNNLQNSKGKKQGGTRGHRKDWDIWEDFRIMNYWCGGDKGPYKYKTEWDWKQEHLGRILIGDTEAQEIQKHKRSKLDRKTTEPKGKIKAQKSTNMRKTETYEKGGWGGGTENAQVREKHSKIKIVFKIKLYELCNHKLYSSKQFYIFSIIV